MSSIRVHCQLRQILLGVLLLFTLFLVTESFVGSPIELLLHRSIDRRPHQQSTPWQTNALPTTAAATTAQSSTVAAAAATIASTTATSGGGSLFLIPTAAALVPTLLAAAAALRLSAAQQQRTDLGYRLDARLTELEGWKLDAMAIEQRAKVRRFPVSSIFVEMNESLSRH